MADVKEDTNEVTSQIIMKVDSPPEESNSVTDQDEPTNSSTSNDTSRPQNFAANRSKTSVIAPPRFNSNNPFSVRPSGLNNTSRNILRPPQLGLKAENKPDTSKSQFSLNPSRLNVFTRVDKEADETNNKNGSEPETPKFVPLAVTESSKTNTTNTNSNSSSAPNFIFGHNLHERVNSENNSDAPVASTSCTNTNGTSEFLFRMAAKSVTSDSMKDGKTLTESAREYEESRANKRKYEEVTVVTGEEDEKNVLQINCKLFAFDKSTGNWQERGRGTLRLNDFEIDSHPQSRLVIRTAGSLRVVLNTKIWAEMTVDRASPKSIRLTAMESSGQVRVFLIMASAEEVSHLHRLLELRVQKEKQSSTSSSSNPESEPPSSKKSAVDSCDL